MQATQAMQAGTEGPQPAAHVVKPPARRARIIALVLSVVAVGFSIGFGIHLRRTLAVFDRNKPEAYAEPLFFALLFLLLALLTRMAAAVCELLWLERTWSNLPERLRKVGPIENVSSGMALGLSVVPGVSWVWKLGLVVAVADGFERVRKTIPFRAPVPKALGIAAVMLAWLPGLNVYLAPFLWEIFATKIDVACNELLAAQAATSAPSAMAAPVPSSAPPV